MEVTITEGAWGSGSCYILAINGEFLCKAFKESSAEKMREWLLLHGIDGRKKFMARPYGERFDFHMAVAGERCPFSFSPWCIR